MKKEESLSIEEIDFTQDNCKAKVVLTEFKLPLVRDGLVLGRRSPVGCHAIRRILHLLSPTPFAHIELDDEVISDIIVREVILKRVPRECLIRFTLSQLRNMMSSEEILQFEMVTENTVTLHVAASYPQNRNGVSDRA